MKGRMSYLTTSSEHFTECSSQYSKVRPKNKYPDWKGKNNAGFCTVVFGYLCEILWCL